MTYYKIVRKDENGDIKFLFHGVGGSRKIPRGEWLKADQKMVVDGDRSRSTEYRSGFHVFISREGAEKYMDLFKDVDDKLVVACEVDQIWSKRHSRSEEVRLAGRIRVIE